MAQGPPYLSAGVAQKQGAEYLFAKVAGRGDDLDTLRQTLGARFDRKRRTEEEPEPST